MMANYVIIGDKYKKASGVVTMLALVVYLCVYLIIKVFFCIYMRVRVSNVLSLSNGSLEDEQIGLSPIVFPSSLMLEMNRIKLI
jgi:hypothetical protein